jgi:hypothetical protein
MADNFNHSPMFCLKVGFPILTNHYSMTTIVIGELYYLLAFPCIFPGGICLPYHSDRIDFYWSTATSGAQLPRMDCYTDLSAVFA